MFEFLHDLFNLIWTIGEFLVLTVFVKMVIGRWVAEKAMKWLVSQNERNLAIWQHYQSQVAGNGHIAASVLDCQQEKCAVFNGTATAHA